MKKLFGTILLAGILLVPASANANEEEFYEHLKTCTPYNAYYPNNGAGKIITGGTVDSCEVTVVNYPDKYYKCVMTKNDIERAVSAFDEGPSKNRAIIIKRKDGTIGKYNGWSGAGVFWNELTEYDTVCKKVEKQEIDTNE